MLFVDMIKSNNPIAHTYLAYIAAAMNIDFKILHTVFSNKNYVETLISLEKRVEIRYLMQMKLVSRSRNKYERTVLGERIHTLIRTLMECEKTAEGEKTETIIATIRNIVGDRRSLSRLMRNILILEMKAFIKQRVYRLINEIKRERAKPWSEAVAETILDRILELAEYKYHLEEKDLDYLATLAYQSLKMSKDMDKLKEILDKFPEVGKRLTKFLFGGGSE